MPGSEKITEVREFIFGQASLHSKSVELDTEKLESDDWPYRLVRLKREPEHRTQSLNPFRGCCGNVRSGGGREDSKEVVEVMFDQSGDVALYNPVKRFSKKVEDVRCRAQAEDQYHIVVEFAVPVATYEEAITVV